MSTFPASRQWLLCTIFLVSSVVAGYYMRIGSAAAAADKHFTEIFEVDRYQFPDTTVFLRQKYTGIGPIDIALSFLVAAFLPGSAGWDKSFQLLQAYFLFSFFPVLAVWSIEAARSRNLKAAISYTTLWAIPYQTVGGAIAIPLWFFCYIITTSKTSYWAKRSQVPVASSRALMPALVLGYLVPTTLYFTPFGDINTKQLMVALWQPSPFIVNGLWFIGTKWYSSSARKEIGQRDDLPYLRTLYKLTFLVSSTVHFAIVYLCVTDLSPATLNSVFIPVNRETWSMTQALLFIFQIDCWIILGVAIVWCYLAVYDLRKLNMTNAGFGSAISLITVGAIICGPGAALSAVAYWREVRMCKQDMEAKKTR